MTDSPGPRLAKRVVIDTLNQTVTIDGDRFPWYIAEGGVYVPVPDGPALPTVELKVLADEVVVVAPTTD